MKKNFKYYALIWATLLAIYNVVVFTVRALPGYVINYDARFWLSWVFVVLAFVGQLICARSAFMAESNKKLFLNIPLITVSYTSTVLMTIAGSVCMLIPDFPAWISAIICVIIFAFSAISVVKAKAAAEIVSDVGERVKSQTSFIKSLKAEAEILVVQAKTPEIKVELMKVYEAIRYSDPMSNKELAIIEKQIVESFSALRNAVKNDSEAAPFCAVAELLLLINERNRMCALNK